jgi:hypothetical protein
MVRRELRGPRFEREEPSLRAELDHLAPSFRAAAHAAAEAYERAGVRYVLIGGVAAGAYSRPRATKDVDFLVGDEAFDSFGAVISFKRGIPLEAHGVPIDTIPLSVEYRELYERVLGSAVEDDEPGILIASAAMVAVTKLAGGRPRDITAVVEMMQADTVDPDELERLVVPYEKLRLACGRALREYEDSER